MIAHVRVPQFYVRALKTADGTLEGPAIVTDESRVIDATEGAIQLGVTPGSLLETATIPDSITVLPFDLEQFVTVQNIFYQNAKEQFPIIENFRFGEILCEIEDIDHFKAWVENNPLDAPLEVAGAVAKSGWLARILSERQQPGEYKILPDESHGMALKTVETHEIWGLGREFLDQLRDAPVETFAELSELEEPDRRKYFGSTSRALGRLLKGEDPKPLNPFSRPRSISQDVSCSDRETVNAEDVRNELESIVTRFRHQLDEVRCLTHQLELILHTDDRQKSTSSYTFTNPTDQPDPMSVGLNTMLRELTIPENLESAKLRANSLVANVQTYHRQAQESHENLEIL